MKELVSVIIPTYGRADYLTRAIDSAISQSYPEVEIIVVDDNNPDTADRKNTEAAVSKYLHRADFSYLKHETNKNGAAARNTGLRHARGKYIAFLDDDDEFLSEKIEKQVRFLKLNPQFEGCYCKTNLMENNNIYYRSSYSKQGNLALDILTLKSECFTPSLCIRKEALVQIGGFNEKFKRHQDFELLLKYFTKFQLGFVDEYLLNVHIDSRKNQPEFDALVALKKQFLSEFKEHIESFDQETQKHIYQQHNFELFVYAVRKRDLKNSLKYFIKTKPDCRLLADNFGKVIKVVQKNLN